MGTGSRPEGDWRRAPLRPTDVEAIPLAALAAAARTGGVGRSGTGAMRGLDFDPFGRPGRQGGSAGHSWLGGTRQGGCVRNEPSLSSPEDVEAAELGCLIEMAATRADSWRGSGSILGLTSMSTFSSSSSSKTNSTESASLSRTSALTALSGARGRRASSARVGRGGRSTREEVVRGGALQ